MDPIDLVRKEQGLPGFEDHIDAVRREAKRKCDLHHMCAACTKAWVAYCTATIPVYRMPPREWWNFQRPNTCALLFGKNGLS
jgi:hypothetical protein